MKLIRDFIEGYRFAKRMTEWVREVRDAND